MNEREKCPLCGNEVQYSPPAETDKRNKTMYIKFICPKCGHEYIKKVPLQG